MPNGHRFLADPPSRPRRPGRGYVEGNASTVDESTAQPDSRRLGSGGWVACCRLCRKATEFGVRSFEADRASTLEMGSDKAEGER